MSEIDVDSVISEKEEKKIQNTAMVVYNNSLINRIFGLLNGVKNLTKKASEELRKLFGEAKKEMYTQGTHWTEYWLEFLKIPVTSPEIMNQKEELERQRKEHVMNEHERNLRAHKEVNLTMEETLKLAQRMAEKERLIKKPDDVSKEKSSNRIKKKDEPNRSISNDSVGYAPEVYGVYEGSINLNAIRSANEKSKSQQDKKEIDNDKR
ncbi:MAG: hypothetical protein IKI57_02670 [Clostridia bacterium]|nr:hypothetical protein [Clostridia bacterium]